MHPTARGEKVWCEVNGTVLIIHLGEGGKTWGGGVGGKERNNKYRKKRLKKPGMLVWEDVEVGRPRRRKR